jgi:hypothetical protein
MGMWRGPCARNKGEGEDGAARTTEATTVGSPEAKKTAEIGAHRATIGGEVEREVAEGCRTRRARGSGSRTAAKRENTGGGAMALRWLAAEAGVAVE